MYVTLSAFSGFYKRPVLLTLLLIVGASYWICVWGYQATSACFPLFSEICAWGALASLLDQLPRSPLARGTGSQKFFAASGAR